MRISALGHLSKASREDSQLYSFLMALTVHTPVDAPFTVGPGSDPPDRRLTGASGRAWDIELAELTLPRVRIDLARIRAFGRRLETLLTDNLSRYPHLVGNTVMLTLLGEASLPRDDRSLLTDITDALTADRGCWLDGVDMSNGLPSSLGHAGFYPLIGALATRVERGGHPGSVQVIATVSRAIYPHEAVEALRDLVRDKDRPENEILLVTCGAPDELGHICGFDRVLLGMLEDAARSGTLLAQDPTHLKAVALHYWGLPTLIGIKITDEYTAPWDS
ncbi:hypothetical protein ACFZBU_27325 [Embleya sp. NPDC008237]|uniref:hypothetical protein n=1 Tax=Embleya sp. NPDC008237 TaxID=3363978 RepID=UPI0036E3A0FB